MKYKLEELKESDIPSLMRLEEEAFPTDKWSEEKMREEFQEDPLGFRVIKVNRRVVAYVKFQVGYKRLDVTGPENDGIITSVAVAENQRRKGMGKLLIEEAVRLLIKKKCPRIVLYTREDNLAMITLVHELGFGVVNEIDNYYVDNKKALILSLDMGN